MINKIKLNRKDREGRREIIEQMNQDRKQTLRTLRSLRLNVNS